MKRTRSIFSRIFTFNLSIILLGITLLSAVEYMLISQHIFREKLTSLENNARSIITYLGDSASFEEMEDFLYGFSKSANRSILIINANCKVIMSSVDTGIYNRGTVYIDESYCRDVLSGESHTVTGTMGGVYKTEMFTLQIPVIEPGSNERVIGAIFISATAPEMRGMTGQVIRTMLFSIACAVLIILVFSFLMSRRISRPMKKIGAVARSFAHGDFSSRVEAESDGCGITEIAELSAAFNDMADDLSRADNVRSNFISDVSHELRTPMTTIAGFVDGILDGTVPPDRQRDYLLIVRDEVSRLSALVNSFLDVTRRTGDVIPEMTDFDINEMIRRTIISFESRIEEKKIGVEVEFEAESTFAHAAEDSIKQVLTNLVDNAIKFTNEGGVITIKVYTKEKELFVSVHNTGCGISPEDMKMIFERFYKADKSRSVNRMGTGIGLYIVKDIINKHGKEITVRSIEGEFAEFSFNLDCGSAPRY